MLQLTIQNRAIVYDLRKQEPISILDVPAMHQLLDCQTYVETGLVFTNIKTLQPSELGIQSTLMKQILSNNSASFYMLRQTKQVFADADAQEDYSREESPSPVLGLYITYCALDLIELRRLEQRKENNVVIRQIDLLSIFSSFMGKSIFTFFEGNARLYKLILRMLE